MRLLLICVALLGWLLTLPASVVGADELRLGYIGQAFYGVEASHAVLAEAYRRLGHRLVLVKLPPERALVMANQGLLDGDLMRSQTVIEREYANLVRVDFVVAEDEFAAFGIGHVVSPDGWMSLKPYRLASGRVRPLLDYQDRLKITFVSLARQGFALLRARRAELFIMLRSNTCQASRAGFPDIEIQEPAIEKVRFYHYLNNRHAALAQSLASVLQAMQRDGSLARITQAVQQRWARCEVPDFVDRELGQETGG